MLLVFAALVFLLSKEPLKSPYLQVRSVNNGCLYQFSNILHKTICLLLRVFFWKALEVGCLADNEDSPLRYHPYD